MAHYVYIESESSPHHSLYTVGCYDPSGTWHPESDHEDAADAAARVRRLNGGGGSASEKAALAILRQYDLDAAREAAEVVPDHETEGFLLDACDDIERAISVLEGQ